MIHPGLLVALIGAATPKQIAMARQTANSESHIFALRVHDNLILMHATPTQKRLSHVMRSSTLAVIPLQAVSSNQYDNPLSRSGEEPLVGSGPLLSRSFARFS
jgi:hypothetical protein